MTATEELRRMLDERGVEYEAPHAGFTIVRTDNAVCKFYEMLEEPERGVFAVVTTDWLTPEQAIAATLGNEGAGRSNDGVAELEAENARLRELVADMYKAFMHGACYRWCEFKEPCNYISDGKCQWYDRGHELGVEVDDG